MQEEEERWQKRRVDNRKERGEKRQKKGADGKEGKGESKKKKKRKGGMYLNSHEAQLLTSSLSEISSMPREENMASPSCFTYRATTQKILLFTETSAALVYPGHLTSKGFTSSGSLWF